LKKWKFSVWRNKLIGNLKGKILEIGVGTGKNLDYYSSDADITGIDLSSKMLEKARQKVSSTNIKLHHMDAQNLKFKDNTFDYALCTFVLCSVPDPIKAIQEMSRVCKKGGRILMLEHVLSNNWFIALIEHLHNPITRILWGYNVNRKTTENINKAGLNIEKEINLAFVDVFRRIEIIKR